MVELFHKSIGEGFPLVLLHGNPVDHRYLLCFDPIFEPYPVRRIYLDLPGFGNSAYLGATQNINSTEDVGEYVASFLQEYLGEQPFAILGHSFGGFIARYLIGQLPQQIPGAALLTPVAKADRLRRKLPEKKVLFEQNGFLDQLAEKAGAGDIFEFKRVAAYYTRKHWKLFHDFALPGIHSYDRETIARIRKNYELPVQPESVGDPYTKPVVFITGRWDNVVGFQDQYGLLAGYPNANFVILAKAGHDVYFDSPEEVTVLLKIWIEEVLAQL